MKRWRSVALVVSLLMCGALETKAQLVMRGDTRYSVYGSRVRIEIEDLTNFGEKTTDRVRIRLWASKDPWRSYDRGHLIAFSRLSRLRAHQNFSDIHPMLDLHRPSAGWYYVTLTLEERTVDAGTVRWVIRDAVEFDGLHYFQRPWDPFPL